MTEAQPITIALDTERHVSGLLTTPVDARACCVLAHGAGAGMRHAFMQSVADGLAGRGIATVRYQFPYMEKGSGRPDTPGVATATVRAAVAQSEKLAPGLPLFAGGKSFGGRMTSQAQSAAPLAGVRGLFFLGFPLHAAGKPSSDRAGHLAEVEIPMLFLQGTRDELAHLDLLRPVVHKLGRGARLHIIEGADHSFHVLKKSGRDDAAVMAELLDTIAAWIDQTLAR